MAMMERLLLQVFERKKRIVDQVKHQTRLFDQHLASTLLIDGIDPPEWLIRPHPSAAEFEKEEFIMGLLRRPSQSAIPNSSCCRSVNDEAPSLENNEKYPVDLCNDIENVIDTCGGCGEMSVLPEGMENGALDVESGPHGAEYTVFSPSTRNKAETSGIHHDLELSLARLQRSKTGQRDLELRNSAKASTSPSHDVESDRHGAEYTVFSPSTRNKAETSGIHHDLELSLARLQRSKTRQRDLELRNSAKSSRSPAHAVKSENSEGNKIVTFGIACQSKFSAPSSKKWCADAQPVHVPGSCIHDGGEISKGNRIATSGIVCQTNMQYVELSSSSKSSADMQLVHTNETGEVRVISYEGNPICEMSSQQKIYVDWPDVHSSFGDSGEATPLPRSLSGSDCFKESFGRTSGIQCKVQGAIKRNLGDSCNNKVKSINCSENVLRSRRSTCVGDVEDVIKFDDSSNGNKGKTRHECTPQSTSLDHLQEADERCRVDRDADKICHNAQHESAFESSMESRRISFAPDNDNIMEMDVSSKTSELLVEGSSGQESKESKPLVSRGCPSIESRSVTSSQQVSKSEANLQNEPGCNTDLEDYVEDSATGFLPSMKLAEIASLTKSKMGADGDDFTKDTEVLVSSSNSPPNMILEHKQLKFDTLGGSIVSMDIDSTIISKEAILASFLLRQTLVKQWDDKNEEKSCKVTFEDHHDEPIQLYPLPRQMIESSDHTNLVEQRSIPDSNGGESRDSAIGGLSRNIFDDGKTTNLGEQEEPCNEEQRQANSVCSEEGHEADAEPALQEKRFDEGKTTNLGEPQDPCAEEQRQANSVCSEEGHEADAEPALQEKRFDEGKTTNLGEPEYPCSEEQRQANSVCSEEGHEADAEPALQEKRFDEGKTTNLGEPEDPCAEEQRQANCVCSEEGHEADAEPALQENATFLHRIIGSSSSHFSYLVAEDQNDTVLEGFFMATDDDQSCISEDIYSFKPQAVENLTAQNWRIAELLNKSTCLNTPLQHHFMGNTDEQVSRLFQSVPNGLLEHVDLRSSLSTNDGKLVDHAFDGRSYSDCLPYCEAASTRNNRKPYASPVGKLWESIHSNSRSSKRKPSLITELPSIIEEIEQADEAVDGLNEGISVEMVSAKREPLAEISEYPNIPVSDNDNKMARFGLDSMMTEAAFPTTNRKLREMHKKRESKKRDVIRKVKGSKTSESGPNGVRRAVESPKNKLAPPITSSKNGGPGISGKESKLHNIVSNITSFLPLVQPKQASAPAAGKRNVKVKALEAAEAAKRQAEKKEVERKMKKEALKLERERIEKENTRRLELEKIRKDEERKKKEAEMALKKRLRVEEEKREKEKKRKQEPRRNPADRHEISCAGKEQPEAKDLAPDAVLMENLRIDSGKLVMDNGDRKVGNLDDLSETAAGPVGRDTLSSMELGEENGNPEPSYEISPYKCSDDEDEDDMPRDKFIPSWARKRSIARDVFHQIRLDPRTIFPPDSFCSISEATTSSPTGIYREDVKSSRHRSR